MKTKIGLNLPIMRLGSMAPVFLLGANSYAAVTPPSKVGATDSADALLKQVMQKLKKASTYRADFVATEIYPQAIKDVEARGSIVLARPKKWRIEAARFRRSSPNTAWGASGNNTLSVSDGKTHSFEFIHPRSAQFRQQPLSNAVAQTTLADWTPLASFFSGSNEASLKPIGSPKFLAPVKWEGLSTRVILVPIASTIPSSTATAQIFVGKDELVHRLLIQNTTPKGLVQKEWVFRNVKLGQLVASTQFAFKARPGSLPFVPPQKGSKLLAAGSVAPDFALLDSTGKRVKLSDYRGKTVVLDFWASWCWICNKSLPATAALARQYRDQNVVVLAVVMWDTPQSFKSWLSTHHYPEINFAVDPQPQGQDIATKLYHVSARPTLYVIDPAGKVSGTVEGFDDKATKLDNAIRSTLAPETNPALICN